MVEAAEKNPRAIVVKGAIIKSILPEEGYGPNGDDNAVLADIPGVAVEVQLDGKLVWRKDVYPVFIGPQTLFNIPRPRYAQRIASAERKAQGIASKLG